MFTPKFLFLAIAPFILSVVVAKQGWNGWWTVIVGIVGTVCVIVMCLVCNSEDKKERTTAD